MNKGAEDQEGAGVGWVVGEAETSRGSSFYNILPPVVQHYPNSFLGFYFTIVYKPSQFQSKDLPAGKTLLTLGDGLASKMGGGINNRVGKRDFVSISEPTLVPIFFLPALYHYRKKH